MTVEEFLRITESSYIDIAVNEYEGCKNVRRVIVEAKRWHPEDVPADLRQRKIVAIVPYFDRISIEVNKEETWLHNTVNECYVLKASSSCEEEESDREFFTFEEAWEEAKRLAIAKSENYSREHGMEVGLAFECSDDLARIKLRYGNEDSCCHIDVVKR